ncbi:bacteriophage protein [Segniliparus rotundus DSM 44985]|uniref:Bacteriophage protein n=1 Tax=Segniliparus rotundus (strain ATCC BAA-972 / CDC 1076 / CIP 108378 / DSM 44985 / JCM 13578) TaxID=640132 RepID=D6Z9P2_SEGRD|nr:hypothetical protein [Segniliparus rotundus]ADG96569.1 bacteriophage protein [Segniliparus rotundus DSM 44985]
MAYQRTDMTQYPSQHPDLRTPQGDYPPFGRPLTEYFQSWENVPPVLRSDQLTVIYVGVPDERGVRAMWHLAGPRRGLEGVALATDLSGLVMPEFERAWHESAWMTGAVPGHLSWPKRLLNLGVHISAPRLPRTILAADGRLERLVASSSADRYRLTHQLWWNSFSMDADGDLLCFTRTTGFRNLKVRLAKAPAGTLETDPAAFGNNRITVDLPLVASDPFFASPASMGTWRNNEDTATPLDALEELVRKVIPDADFTFAKTALALVAEALGNLIPGIDVGQGHIAVRNDGDVPAWPEYVIHSGSGGFCWLPDGDRMVMLPRLLPTDGKVLVSTDPSKKTFTAENEPVDIGFLGVVARSQLLDLVLKPFLEATEPLWRRGAEVFFTKPIPPKTTVQLPVRHSNENAVITARVPQRHYGPGI